jgi:uncharacterized protein (DUF1778 family)
MSANRGNLDIDRRQWPLSVSMRLREHRAIRRAAFLSDVSISAFIRHAACAAAERTLQASQDPIARQSAA